MEWLKTLSWTHDTRLAIVRLRTESRCADDGRRVNLTRAARSRSPMLWSETIPMLVTIPGVALLLMQATQMIARPAVASPVPFDTTVAAPRFASVALELQAGGTVHVTGGSTNVVRVHVTERGRRCADCLVAVAPTANGLVVRTTRARPDGTPADLRVDVEVPTQSDVSIASAGGAVSIEGVDGTVSGSTDAGALDLLRLSGTVTLVTKRGDVSLRQSYVTGRVHTVDGRVLLEDVAGNVEGSTSRGRVIERRVEHTQAAP
jgi:hypothetical protein